MIYSFRTANPRSGTHQQFEHTLHVTGLFMLGGLYVSGLLQTGSEEGACVFIQEQLQVP